MIIATYEVKLTEKTKGFIEKHGNTYSVYELKGSFNDGGFPYNTRGLFLKLYDIYKTQNIGVKEITE